jgi:hypothetical protein
MWFVMGAGEEAEHHQLMNSNVNCTCPPPSLWYALHDEKGLDTNKYVFQVLPP